MTKQEALAIIQAQIRYHNQQIEGMRSRRRTQNNLFTIKLLTQECSALAIAVIAIQEQISREKAP